MKTLKKVVLASLILGVAALSLKAKGRWSAKRNKKDNGETGKDKSSGKGRKPSLRHHV